MSGFNVGDHCKFEKCNCLDFLPFTCDLCSLVYCKDHREPQKHECANLKEPEAVDPTTLPSQPRYECTFVGCKKSELVPVKCSSCGKLFCLQHRSQEDHQCITQVTNDNINKKLIILSSLPKTSSTSKFKGVKSEKLAAKVQVMKLKQKSTGRKDIPEEHRVYFSVEYLFNQQISKSSAIFVSCHWTVGKALDYFCDKMNISNKNLENMNEKLRLCSSATGQVYPADENIKVLLESQRLFNGSTVVITSLPVGITEIEFS